MNGVIGLSALALDCTNLEEIKPFLQRINQSSVSLMAILNDILDLSKIQEQGFSLDNRTFMLDDLITPLNDLFNLTAQQSGVSYSMLCDQHIPPYLWGDELRLRQVLVNLLGNAFKFTAQGEVRLAISVIESSSLPATNVRLRFCVSDTGVGLSAEQVKLIFDRFTQADTSVTRSFGGTGLGLTISQELVLAMGGVIQVQSSLGQGAVFFFELDFKRMDNPAGLVTNNVIEISAHNVLQGKRVLMVEDDSINQLVTGLLLKKIGVEYDIAQNGEIALECIKNKAYDLILMDVQMPVMDGIEATQQLRQLDDYKALPIIAMSAGVMLEEKQACTNAGMNGFVAKPTTIEQLTKELLRLLA
jgi:CheY-like chemotaxis protein